MNDKLPGIKIDSDGIPYVSLLEDWSDCPHERLRKYPDGTVFLWKWLGRVHVCELTGNLDSDKSWKAVRRSDGKYIRLEKYPLAEFILIIDDKNRIRK